MAGVQSIRGMNDVLPHKSGAWLHLEEVLKQIALQFGYQEIRFPIVEKTELFKRSIGEATDIVEKEMYTFDDRNGDSLTLRPEGTAGCVRAGIEHGLLYNQVQKLWYMGPMFRHERPQKGRYRQFHQFGVEAFGLAGPIIDVELLLFSASLWQGLGLSSVVTLELNTLGTSDERAQYREHLVAYLKEHEAELDEDSVRRLETNPLRILDSKNPAMQNVIQSAPKLFDSLGDDSRQYFEQVISFLDKQGIGYKVNPCLVRGLDYYDHVVFEWVTEKLGAQSAVCAGGRYDSLVPQLGGRQTQAMGFAIGIERVLELMEVEGVSPNITPVDIYVLHTNEVDYIDGYTLAEQLRSLPQKYRVLQDCNGGAFKKQFKRAEQSGAHFVICMESADSVTIKFLAEERAPLPLTVMECIQWFKDNER